MALYCFVVISTGDPEYPMNSLIKLSLIIITPFLFGLIISEKRDADNQLLFQSAVYEANPEYLDGPLTGGFGELTCHSCHFDYDLNMTDRGSLTVDGLDELYIPDHTYELKVTIKSDHLEKGGFQMTSRFEDGSQAGSFNWDGDRLMFTPSIKSEVQYIQHSRNGTSVTSPRTVEWSFYWTAPKSDMGPVQFNIASNAANDDDSSFGDWIYIKEFELVPVD